MTFLMIYIWVAASTWLALRIEDYNINGREIKRWEVCITVFLWPVSLPACLIIKILED